MLISSKVIVSTVIDFYFLWWHELAVWETFADYTIWHLHIIIFFCKYLLWTIRPWYTWNISCYFSLCDSFIDIKLDSLHIHDKPRFFQSMKNVTNFSNEFLVNCNYNNGNMIMRIVDTLLMTLIYHKW